MFFEPDVKAPKEPQGYVKKEEAEDDDEPEAPLTEEEEMEQSQENFMADQHDDYPEGFMDER